MPKINLKKFVSTIMLISMSFTFLGGFAPTRAYLDECTSGVCYSLDTKSEGVWYEETAPAIVGGEYPYNIAFWNASGQTITNINVRMDLASGLTYKPGTMVFFGINPTFNENDLFTPGGIDLTGVSIAHNESFQLNLTVRVDERPAGAFSLTSTIFINSSLVNVDNDVTLEGTSTGPTPGKLLVNEINHAPRADWSQDGDYRLSGRTDINNDDEWIEFFVKDNGLDLTSADWTLYLENIPGGGVMEQQLLAAGAGYQYIGSGTETNTQTGDYLLLNNPDMSLTDNATVRVKYLGTSMDEITYNSSNTGLLDETIGRNASSLDTDSGSDWLRNHGTPGRANTARVDGTYEAEIYMASNTAIPRGEDVFNAGASDGLAVRLNSGVDINGEVFRIDTQEHASPGHYRVKLRAKVSDNSGNVKVGAFYVKYPNPRNKRTGFQISSRDFPASNTYRDFVIEIAKPDTSGSDNNYIVEFDNTSGRNLVVDKLSVSTFTPWSSADCPSGVCTFEAENMFSKTGSSTNDAGASAGKAMLTPGSTISDPYRQHALYGPYTAHLIDLGGTQELEARFTIKFTNITAVNPDDRIARLEVSNNFPNQKTTLDIYKQDVPDGNYNDYLVQFISSLHGSYQLRIVSFGNADLYADKVAVKATAGAKIIIESESYDDISGLIGTKVSDPLAANGVAMRTLPAAGPGWIQAYAPSYTDFVGSGKNVKASFALRTNSAAPGDVNTVDVRAYHHTIGGSRMLLASRTIYGDLLSNTEYRNFDIVFKAPATGTISYRIYYRNAVGIFVDRTTVQSYTIPNPKVRQAEYFRNVPGTVVSDALAMANPEQNGDKLAVRGTGGASTWLLAGGPNEMQPAGTYTVTYYLRKSGPGGNPAATMGKLQVKDSVTKLVVAEQYVQETDITNGSYTAITLPSFSKGDIGRLDLRTVYYGSLTSFDLYIDRVEVNRVGGFN